MGVLAVFEVDGVEWTEYEWRDGVVWQRICPTCDKGMLLAPARFCNACGGSGFVISVLDPRGE